MVRDYGLDGPAEARDVDESLNMVLEEIVVVLRGGSGCSSGSRIGRRDVVGCPESMNARGPRRKEGGD